MPPASAVMMSHVSHAKTIPSGYRGYKAVIPRAVTVTFKSFTLAKHIQSASFFFFCVALPHCCACMIMYVKQVYNKYTHIYINKLSLGRFSYLNELKTSWHRETTVRNSKALPFRSNLKISGDIKITGKWIFISN